MLVIVSHYSAFYSHLKTTHNDPILVPIVHYHPTKYGSVGSPDVSGLPVAVLDIWIPMAPFTGPPTHWIDELVYNDIEIPFTIEFYLYNKHR